MNMVVCIKQVPDNAQVKMGSDGSLKLDGVTRILNPFDEYAVEEALRIKEKTQGKVTLLCMGPEGAEAALRAGIAMGADEAVLCTDPAFEDSDTNATAKVLAKAIAKIGAGLVLLGKQTMDGDTAQVGPQLAVHAGLPIVMYVKKIEAVSKEKLTVHRMTDEGYDIVECPAPAIIGTVKEINEPRLPSLKGKLRAKDVKISKWGAQDLGLKPEELGKAGSGMEIVQIVAPPKRPEGRILTGEAPAMVDELVAELKKRQLV